MLRKQMASVEKAPALSGTGEGPPNVPSSSVSSSVSPKVPPNMPPNMPPNLPSDVPSDLPSDVPSDVPPIVLPIPVSSDTEQKPFVLVDPPKTRTSRWWKSGHYKLFDKVHHPVLSDYCVCTLCNAKLKYINCTNILQRHLFFHHREVHDSIEPEVPAGLDLESRRKRAMDYYSRKHSKNSTKGDKAKKLKKEVNVSPRAGNCKRAIQPVSKKRKVQSNDRYKEFLRKTTRMIVCETLPYDLVEKSSFLGLTKAISSTDNLFVLSSGMVQSEVRNMAVFIRKKIAETLRTTYHTITADHWTSHENFTFSSITAHWIDGVGRMNSCIMHCHVHRDNSSDASVLEDFICVFNSYSLDLSRIVAVVTESSGCMQMFGMHLASLGVDHLFCIDNIFQQTVMVAFEDLSASDITNAFRVSKQIVETCIPPCGENATLHNVQRKLDQYESCPPVGVLQDKIKTRWWSAYRMMCRLLYLKGAFDHLMHGAGANSRPYLTRDQWGILDGISELLRPFKEAMKTLEDRDCITISFVPAYLKIIRERLVSTSKSEELPASVRALSKKMLDDFVGRWGEDPTAYGRPEVSPPSVSGAVLSRKHFLAVALDPRTKNLVFLMAEDHEKVWCAMLNSLVNMRVVTVEKERGAKKIPDLYDLEAILYCQNPPARTENDAIDKDSLKAFAETEKMKMIYKVKCENEIAKYRQLPVLSLRNITNGVLNDPLLWWFEQREELPTLYKLSKRILALQATSTPSEKVWDLSEVVSSKCAQTLPFPKVAEAIFVKNNLWVYDKFIQDYQNENYADSFAGSAKEDSYSIFEKESFNWDF
uniref:HAT C-terminal dimerisation domain-containing protein n=1 Tax=Corethron hystrix TaxID=216773 RepID=A0A7S1BGQ0_9STRA|mmetsp:Transcript_25527/g.58888  ORF Transcript_25527/g.58888 Transcript_25527/m.58888 type:complete len:817 (+) Transcript_25527:351-2801(+)